MAPWEHFAHGADIGVRGIGPSKAEGFAQAGLALTAVLTDPATLVPVEAVPIRCTAVDDELLLLAWLNALVSEMALRRLLFCRFRVALSPGALEATAWGDPLDPARHAPAVEVKGATCTDLKVAALPDGSWLAQTVVDV